MRAREEASEPASDSPTWGRIYLRIWEQVGPRMWDSLPRLIFRSDEEVCTICEEVFDEPAWLAKWEDWEAELDRVRPDPGGGDTRTAGEPPRALPEPPPEPPGLWNRASKLLEEGAQREKLAAARVRWLLLKGRAVREILE